MIPGSLSIKTLTLGNKEDLRKSGLTDDTIDRYGFYSISKESAAKLLEGYAPSSGWVIEYPRSDFLKFKPDYPVDPKRKYLAPTGKSPDVFITDLAFEALNDSNKPYYFCEGEKKTLALEQAGYASIGISGVWSWSSDNRPIKRFSQINLTNRICYIIFDSDKHKNRQVMQAESKFAEALISLGAIVKIVNLDPQFGKGADDQLLELGESGFSKYIEESVDYQDGLSDDVSIPLPIALPDFLEMNIPPVEYYIEGFLQKQGKTMISAQANIGKSLFVQNMALAIASGHTTFLDRFEVKPGRVLYLDLEMGFPALKERFQKMCSKDVEISPNLYIQNFPALDLLDEFLQKAVERSISELKIDVLILDPVGNAWAGDENDKQQVGRLTTYLNGLISKYGISIIVVHHWRKSYKENKSGGEMAAGSYKWSAWLDHHVTMEGKLQSITITCTKSRNSGRFAPFVVKMKPETLAVEFLHDYEKKYTEQTLCDLFSMFNQERVSVPELIERAKEEKMGASNTIRGLINDSKLFTVDRSDKTHYLERKSDNSNGINDKTS